MRTDQSVANFDLLFEACLGAKLISNFVVSLSYTTPLAPPSDGSPWLDPSKNPHGHVLFISGAIIGRFGFDLGSI